MDLTYYLEANGGVLLKKSRLKVYVVLQQQNNGFIKLFFKIVMSTCWEEIKHTSIGTDKK